jgi:hypothetical protein
MTEQTSRQPRSTRSRFLDALTHSGPGYDTKGLPAPSAEARELASLHAEVAAARKFAEEMRDFCSPYGVATDYADRLIEAMDRAKEQS